MVFVTDYGRDGIRASAAVLPDRIFAVLGTIGALH